MLFLDMILPLVLFGLGKSFSNKEYINASNIFNQTEGFEKDEIFATGKEALVLLYDSSTGQGLDNLQKIL